jgi:hypothetical protein
MWTRRLSLAKLAAGYGQAGCSELLFQFSKVGDVAHLPTGKGAVRRAHFCRHKGSPEC